MRSIEIPVFGRDGEIAGVLCRGSLLSGASRSTPPMQDRDSAIVGEAKTILRDIVNLFATTDRGLWLLRRQTEVEGRQLIVDRMRYSIQRGAGSSRNFLGRAVEIIVAGNGSGMTHEVLWRAFESNFATKLGNVRVSVSDQVQQFVRESGGAIEIKSEVGVGTAVGVMHLPVSRRVDDNSVEPAKFCCNILGPRK